MPINALFCYLFVDVTQRPRTTSTYLTSAETKLFSVIISLLKFFDETDCSNLIFLDISVFSWMQRVKM